MSRFDWRPVLTLERLKDFVALDNLTAQTPLIEVNRNGIVRVWTAYDTTRTMGTFTEIWRDGSVHTVTIYPSGRRHAIINRPAFNNPRVQRKAKQAPTGSRPRRTKKVSKGT
jgi:hypothetical protein